MSKSETTHDERLEAARIYVEDALVLMGQPTDANDTAFVDRIARKILRAMPVWTTRMDRRDSRTEPKPDSVPVICPKCGQPSYRCECANADQPANSQTTIPSPRDASDIEAFIAATGHTEEDAIRILDKLMEAGWVLRPLPTTDVERRRLSRDHKKRVEGFRIRMTRMARTHRPHRGLWSIPSPAV